MNKTTLEKVFEYASVPVQGTMSRKLRQDILLQVNQDDTYSEATIFLSDQFVRITSQDGNPTVKTYYDWDKIASVRTYGPQS